MSIELQYEVFSEHSPSTSSSSAIAKPIFESTIWLPNIKVPIKVLHKVIQRQFSEVSGDDTSFVIYFNNNKVSSKQLPLSVNLQHLF